MEKCIVCRKELDFNSKLLKKVTCSTKCSELYNRVFKYIDNKRRRKDGGFNY